MALPKIQHPIYEIYLKSLDRKVRFRPFLVKEEKLLLMARESKDNDEIKRTVMQVINNCILDENIDVEKLPLFDIEMIFINLRARSIGENAKLIYNCKHKNDEGNPCDTDNPYMLNLDNVQYVLADGHSSTVKITDEVGIKLKYPTIASASIIKEADAYDAALQFIAQNIDSIYDPESVYKAEDLGAAAVIEFVENLTAEQLDKIQVFFATTPKVVLKDTIVCKKCGFEHEVEADNLYSFFT